ncbi:hypothetical protein HOLleu_41140 [Holothuria leucospilota]|uniref:C2H2-type domain-containing protein n=1 Tax=Holothuria leucospilota TaxID=206669 RepID=A0A9Q0YDK3_HOLLE|nr:hypothetical protein HOLleu_41140 [Holothuria leucospilota]
MEAEQSSPQRYLTQYHGHYHTPPSSIMTESKDVVPVGPIVPSLNTADSSYDSVTHVSASNGMPSSQVGSSAVQCLDCRKIFSTQSVLENHSCIKKATSHRCNLCSKTFTRRYNMKIHVQKHFGHFPHRCIICGNGFTKGSALSKHMLKHGVKRSAKLRPQCDICFRVFTRKYTLRLHRAKHMENGQWKCPFCSASFWNSINLKAHLNMHASEGVTQTQPVATNMGDEAKMIPSQENSVPSVVGNEQREVASPSDVEQPVSLTFRPPSGAEDCKDEIDLIEMEDLTPNPCSDLSCTAFETVHDSKLLEIAREGNFSEGIDRAHQKIKEEPDRLDSSIENQKGAVSNVIKNLNDNEGMARGVSTSQGEGGCFNQIGCSKNALLVRENSSDIRGSHQEEESSTARTSTARTEFQVSEVKPFIAQDVKVSEPEKAKYIHKPRNNGLSPSEVISSALEIGSCTQSLSSQTQTYSKETLITTPSHRVGPTQSDTPTTTAPSMSPVLRTESGPSNMPSVSSEVARPSWRCAHCRISFEDSLLYVIHMGCHSHSNPFACNMCGHVSADRVTFMLHFVQGQH